MARLTIAQVNNVLQEYNLQLVKGNGYFYYASATIYAEVQEWRIPSVMTTRLNTLTLEEWVDHALEHLTKPD